jgi:hypothetical protein
MQIINRRQIVYTAPREQGLEIKMKHYKLTDFDVYTSSDGEWFSIDFGINDNLLVQYDKNNGFSIPSSDERYWNDREIQDQQHDLNQIISECNLSEIAIILTNAGNVKKSDVDKLFETSYYTPRCVF